MTFINVLDLLLNRRVIDGSAADAAETYCRWREAFHCYVGTDSFNNRPRVQGSAESDINAASKYAKLITPEIGCPLAHLKVVDRAIEPQAVDKAHRVSLYDLAACRAAFTELSEAIERVREWSDPPADGEGYFDRLSF